MLGGDQMFLLTKGTHADNGLPIAGLAEPKRRAAIETDSKHSGRTTR
jgi:hypothetical protein